MHDKIANFTQNVNSIDISDETIDKLEKQFELFKIKVLKIMKTYS